MIHILHDPATGESETYEPIKPGLKSPGENAIKVHRLMKNKLRQYEMAEVIGVSQGQLSNIERGAHEPGLYTAMKIAYMLDTDVYALWDFQEAIKEIEYNTEE